jgi:hypothetical protein
MKKKRQRKNCPQCIYLAGLAGGTCAKNPERDIYTIHTLPEEPKEREWCTDMKKRKVK